ncbi:MAG TPA: ATP-dependent helicase [Tepidisphaeraceae bacterium]|jgi:DNA helicase-2/ATP-dependent DNA helicase PcrA|nr:ATP-dependent helicase [Tepidisphaeraceae bacterium]
MDASFLKNLNDQQRGAATFGDSPLLIIAGAGTGKTNTLAHRVAHLISTGVNPSRILLLTFTRRASAEMLKRVGSILASVEATKAAPAAMAARVWGGTFHATANRLLRIYGRQAGLGENFTVADRSDAEDLLNDVRGEIGLDAGDVRFPRKGTALAIYSRCVNASEPVEHVLKSHFPWCASYPDQLKKLFVAYTRRKQEQAVLDYDDLLLYWFHLMEDPALAADVRGRFDAVLVDEYQDTNRLQAGILQRLSPEGKGLSVVGDDAQSIYSFRAATVHNILDFPSMWPGATVLKLEENYRSVQPILDATNNVIALCPNRYNKDLFSRRRGAQKPKLVTLVDEDQQSDYVIRKCLEHLEAGIPLSRQAVLFRTSHHSDALEVELARRNIPFVKYGGLKFLEAGHVKDVLSILRLAENPRDSISAFRVLQLLDGVGPAHARRAIAHFATRRFDLRSWESFSPPAAAEQQWGDFVAMLVKVAPNHLPLPEQVAEVKRFYAPILEKRYDQALIRRRDLDQLEQISTNFRSRSAMLTDLALDPPSATQDLAGPPLREEDFLILSTIHSAKGCEWDAVYVIHAADGNIPSDMATGSEEEIEEERRLFYVAMTRAKDFLEVCVPLRYYQKKHATGDRHTYAQPSRFLPDQVLHHFERVSMEPKKSVDLSCAAVGAGDIRKKIAAMWM